MSTYNNNPLPHPTKHANSVKPYGDEELKLAQQINEQLATHGWKLRTLSKRKHGYSFYITKSTKDLRGKDKQGNKGEAQPKKLTNISPNIAPDILPNIPKKNPPKYRRIIPQQ